ncbi:MAG: hypothetical protein LBR31_07390 [Desulfovibrio sp.]|jgi:flagellin-like hook-associated protein FlgL|nr:hypothetical protein [Desulfovibrio sp.]
MDLEQSSLLQDVMNSKIASLLYTSMGEQQREDRRVPDSTRRAFLSRMKADAVTARQGAQNMEDAVSMVTTAQTGVTAIKQMLTDMRKIAVDMDTATGLTQDQYVGYLNQLLNYAQRMTDTAGTTQFNGFKLLDGSAGLNGDGVFQLQAGNSSLEEVLVNMLDGGAAANKTLDGTKLNLGNMAAELQDIMNSVVSGPTLPSQADIQTATSSVLALIGGVFDRVAGIEARYSNDIKSLDNLRVLLESQGDIFDNVQKYHQENTDASSKSYLDLLMNSSTSTGSILSGTS